MTQAAVLAQHIDATPAEYDRLAFAAYPRWRDNHHDVYDALVYVFHHHVDGRMQELAGHAADEALITPIVRRAFEIEFEARARSER